MNTKLICLINNYNYSNYLAYSLDSALKQSVPFDRIIVVDDGSTDKSREIILNYEEYHKKIISVFKENGGQLSTFNTALKYIEDNSQIFFLDADDIYPKDYLELYQQKLRFTYPDFVYCRTQIFENAGAAKVETSFLSNESNQVFLKTSALVRGRGVWIGNPTSCISISSDLYKKLFPYPYPEDFKTRADDVIIYGASIAGAQKVYVPSLQIGYRKHGANYFHGKEISKNQACKHDQAIKKMFSYYCILFAINENPSPFEFFAELNKLGKAQRKSLKIGNLFKAFNRLLRKKYLSGI